MGYADNVVQETYDLATYLVVLQGLPLLEDMHEVLPGSLQKIHYYIVRPKKKKSGSEKPSSLTKN